jgi:hypothetical protein
MAAETSSPSFSQSSQVRVSKLSIPQLIVATSNIVYLCSKLRDKIAKPKLDRSGARAQHRHNLMVGCAPRFERKFMR